MLIIRAEQMQALAEDRTRQFRQRLRAHLGGALPPDEDAELQLTRCIDAAAAFGLHSERDVVRFAELTWRYAAGYPATALPRPALAILMSHGLDPARKLSRYANWVASMAAGETAHD